MNASIKSGFLLTEQTRYSQDIFNSGLSSIRKRINVLSTTNISSSSSGKQYPTSISNPQSVIRSGMIARMAKMVFDAEMLEQDVKTELYELKKTKQYLSMVGEDVKRNTGQVEQLFNARLGELESRMESIVADNLKKGKRLNAQVQARRLTADKLKVRMAELGRRVKHVEDSLGCYTGHDKLEST